MLRETDGEHTNVYSGLNNVDFFEDTSVQSRFLIDDGGPKTWDIRASYSDVSGGTINSMLFLAFLVLHF